MQSVQRALRALLALTLLLGAFVAGCDDDVTKNQFSPSDLGGADFVPPESDATDDTRRPLPDTPGFEDCCLLIRAGAVDSYQVHIGRRISLGAILYSRESGNPIEGERITWSLDGDGSSTLSSTESITSADGLAEVEFIAGDILGNFTVTADYPEARETSFSVDVVQLPNGDLQVNVINSAANILEVAPYDVYVYPGDFLRCRHMAPLSMPSEYIELKQAAATGDQVLFEGLLSEDDYVVAGVAYDENGKVIAKACVEGITIPNMGVEELDLVFQLIPLNPVGTYRVRAYFDFGDALASAGPFGETLVMIFEGFNNPGRLIYDGIFAVFELFIPSFFCSALDGLAGLTGLDAQLQDAISGAILGTSFGCTVVRAGCNVRDTVRNLQVLSTVYLSKLGANFGVFGSTSFTGLILSWNGNDLVLANDVLQSDLQLLSGDWEGSVVGYDRLLIQNHPVDLRYGELIVYIINQVILPSIAGGATSFSDALVYWINCDGIATNISNISVAGQSISYDTAYGACEGTIGFLGTILGFGEALLSLQNLPSTLSLAGEVTLAETTGDFQVDELRDGNWGGVISFGDGSAPIQATWSGCNINTLGPDCDYPDVGFVTPNDGACGCNEDCSNCQD